MIASDTVARSVDPVLGFASVVHAPACFWTLDVLEVLEPGASRSAEADWDSRDGDWRRGAPDCGASSFGPVPKNRGSGVFAATVRAGCSRAGRKLGGRDHLSTLLSFFFQSRENGRSLIVGKSGLTSVFHLNINRFACPT